MPEITVQIRNEAGMHARPSALLVQTASKFKADVKVEKDGREVDGRSIMGLMTLAAKEGSTLTLRAKGEDATQVLAEMKALIDNGFEEK